MRIFYDSTPIYESKPFHKKLPRINLWKPTTKKSKLCDVWKPNTKSKLSDSSLSSTTEELSLSSSFDSLPKDFDTFPDYSSSKSRLDVGVTEKKIDTRGLVGIIITAPRTSLSKRVRFGGVQVMSTHTPASEMTDDELSRTHYQASDYEFFRGTSQFIATEIRKQAYGEQHLQQQTTTKTKPNPDSYSAVMTKTYQMCRNHSGESLVNLTDNDGFEQRKSNEGDSFYPIGLDSCTVDSNIHTCLTPLQFEALTHWVRVGHSRRGLEKFSVPYLVEARPLSRNVAKNAVLVAQEVLKELDNYIDKKKEERRMKNEKGGIGNHRQHVIWGLLSRLSYFRGQKIGRVKHESHNETDDYCRNTLRERLAIPKDVILPSLSKEQVLQIVSEEYTRTAKLFAMNMGHADAAALQLYINNSKNT